MPKRSAGERKFDITGYHRRHIALKIAYFGAAYRGLATQDGTDETVEGQLFLALKKTRLIDPEYARLGRVRFSRCGRTDRGVSSFGNVVAAFIRSSLQEPPATHTGVWKRGSPDQPEMSADPKVDDSQWWPIEQESVEHDFATILNRVLPDDIRVLAWAPVQDRFSARFSCLQRVYRYYFAATDVSHYSGAISGRICVCRSGSIVAPPAARPSWDGEKEWTQGGWLDIGAMAAAAQRFTGTHDFRNFCKLDVVMVRSFIRAVAHVIIGVPSDDGGIATPTPCQCEGVSAPHPDTLTSPRVYVAEIVGNAFLYHQIRAMMGILFLVGRRLEPQRCVADLLDLSVYDSKPQYKLAPENGLTLFDCAFASDVGPDPPSASTNAASDDEGDSAQVAVGRTARLPPFGWIPAGFAARTDRATMPPIPSTAGLDPAVIPLFAALAKKFERDGPAELPPVSPSAPSMALLRHTHMVAATAAVQSALAHSFHAAAVRDARLLEGSGATTMDVSTDITAPHPQTSQTKYLSLAKRPRDHSVDARVASLSDAKRRRLDANLAKGSRC